ncbi:MAG: polysaccharide biosynthesis tyrosine autokinase [Bradyrhizobium sp.]|uniref:polysaccharide biosynthesis tyrosine autokinase n=1 Tax=Bradyrhizobium sp. TaxID=376 RepID=UPI0029A2C1DA|nr:polysaccharide biosynthesis tyrosine autokinase [Bradyrhizobium sp.]MDX3969777.1 polysaccharide biosynthesis tyrosine autokinase [Bradyrhizobium sp.]
MAFFDNEGIRMDARLKFGGQSGARIEPDRLEETVTISELVEQFTGFIRRQFPIFIFFLACALAVGAVYLFTTPPIFTSHAMLLIDSSKVRILQQDAPLGDLPIDAGQVETQVEILKSEGIGLSVIKELKLTEDSEFVGGGGGVMGMVRGLFQSPGVQSDTALTRAALGSFLARRTVTRVGRTYVLDIGFTSLDGNRAATIANAMADAYIVDQLESKYQATRRASRWLQDRIKELRQQASDADRAVQDYKEKNNIVSVGGNSGTRLLGEQQLEELNSQLSTARASAEEAKARLERITQVLKKDVANATVDATVTDSLKSDVINRLRSNYLDLAAKESIWSTRYGPNHLAAVNLRTQMAELRRSIVDELGRIAEGYKSDYEIAKSRVDGLEQNLKNLITNSQTTNRDRLGLRDLESTAKVYHTLYDNFLQRYMEAIQQQSFPITEARVISAAAAPQGKSGPLTFTVLGIASFIGLALSFAAAVLREAVDQVFRTARDVESSLHVNCLAVLPSLRQAGVIPPRAMLDAKQKAGAPAKKAYGASDDLQAAEVVSLAPRSSIEAGAASSERKLDNKQKLSDGGREFMRQVVDDPLSGFAEGFRSIKIAADIGGSGGTHRVIGITSTIPGEGKSTIASNLAQLIAHSGRRVMLIDSDLRNPTLSRSLMPNVKSGLIEVLNGEVDLKDVICSDDQTGLDFVPTRLKPRFAHTNEILASDEFKVLVDGLRATYDYVIVDLPPLAPVVDVRATTKIFDSYLYVIEWGKTRKGFVERQLSSAPEVYDLLLGVVLNKADVRVMGRYEDGYGRYSGQYYGHYGYSG